MDTKLISAEHIGDGLYFTDEGWCIAIAVNHHSNTVASLDIHDIDTAIAYLQKVKNKNNGTNNI